MRIKNLSWMQVEEYLKRDDRAVLPVGSTEQHAYLSLATDNLLAERVAAEAAEPLGIPVFPVVSYGITPNFRAYPAPSRCASRRSSPSCAIASTRSPRRVSSRVVIVNGHGGNLPAMAFVNEWVADHPGAKVKFHNWWNAPKTIAKVHEIDPVASHASWMESFPWTRASRAWRRRRRRRR